MKSAKELPDAIKNTHFWFSTNRRAAGFLPHHEIAVAAIAGGAQGIEFCEHNFNDEEFVTEALKVKEVCDRFQVPLIIKHHVVAAFIIDAAGVHLTDKDMPIDEARRILGKGKVIFSEADLPGIDYLVAEGEPDEGSLDAFVHGCATKMILSQVGLKTKDPEEACRLFAQAIQNRD